MTALRILCIVAWLAVVIYMAPAVWALVCRRDRQGDPARFVCFLYAIVAIGFSSRWLLVPDDQELWIALYVLSIVSAVFTLMTARSYGRGPRG